MDKSYIVSTIVENIPVAENTYKMRLTCPEIAQAFKPGQFCMLRVPGVHDPLLGRPLAIYDLWLDGRGNLAGIDVMYLVVGKATELFKDLRPGQLIEVWGPLGNGFSLENRAKHIILLAGGIGQTPMLTLAKEALGRVQYTDAPYFRREKVSLCYGAKSRAFFARLEDFHSLGLEMNLVTVDGSAPDGFPCSQGFATDPMRQIFESESAENLYVYACGPKPMLIAAQKLLNQFNVQGQISLETPMACGLGICFTCVAKIQDEQGNWDYKRTCKEGPVFDARKILWENG